MNNSRLYIAIAALIALVVAVVYTRRAHTAETTLAKPSASLPVIDKGAVTELSVQKPGQPAVVLQKQAEKWAVTAPLAAEANQDTVSAMLDKLADLKVTGVAATRKENLPKLEVDAAKGIHVIAKAGEKSLIDLYVGATKGASTVVRQEGQDVALSVRSSIRYLFDKELKDFRKREITDLDVEQLSGLDLQSAKGTFKFVRGANNAWEQAKGEKAIAKFDPEQVASIASQAAHLRATDFAQPGDGDAVTGLASPSATVVLTKKDGSAVTVKLGKQQQPSLDYYTQSSESPVVYRLSKFAAERFMPEAKNFEKVDKPAQAAAPQGMPPGMGGPGGPHGGANGITPEMMEQIKKQLAAQGH